MSDDKGKELEMDVIILIANMGKKHPKVDLTRYTTTNTADNGLDVEMTATENSLKEFIDIANGNITVFSDPKKDSSKKVLVRIDAKYREEAITKPETEKFVDEIAKHPKKKGHILLGSNLTDGAKKVIENAQSTNPKKVIVHIDNEGVENLKNAILPKVSQDTESDT